MAGIKISNLPLAPSALLTDVMPIDQLPGPGTFKQSLQQVQNLFLGDILFSTNTMTSKNTNENINISPNGTGSIFFYHTSGALSGSPGQVQTVDTTGHNASFVGSSYSNAAGNSPAFLGYKSRSTVIGSFTAVQANDVLCSFSAAGDDGTQFSSAASIAIYVGGAVSNGVVPGKIGFITYNTSGNPVTAMTIDDAQITTLANPLPVGSGGLGITSTPTNGQIPIGNGTTYIASTLTAGTGVTITNGAGSITVATVGGGFSTASVAGTSQTAVANTQYFLNNAGATTVTTPTTASSTIGDTIKIKGASSAAWIIQAAAGQTIKNGASASSVAGTATSHAGTDSIQFVYISANTWSVDWFLGTNLTLA